MEGKFKKEGRYSYFEAGEGTPIVVLHGLMGGLSNFGGVADFFPSKGYKVVIPELPLYTQNILKTNVKAFAKYVKAADAAMVREPRLRPVREPSRSVG